MTLAERAQDAATQATVECAALIEQLGDEFTTPELEAALYTIGENAGEAGDMALGALLAAMATKPSRLAL